MQKVLTCAQMRAADKYTIGTLGVPAQELMERAGRAIAEEVRTLLESMEGRSVLAVCGGGNNGGDGWCAARLLSDWGYETAVYTRINFRPTVPCRENCTAVKCIRSFPKIRSMC